MKKIMKKILQFFGVGHWTKPVGMSVRKTRTVEELEEVFENVKRNDGVYTPNG